MTPSTRLHLTTCRQSRADSLESPSHRGRHARLGVFAIATQRQRRGHLARAARSGTVAICASLAVGAPQAIATQSAYLPVKEAAIRFARTINRDAHEQVRKGAAAVTVVKRCCATRVLRVHYRTKPGGTIEQGSYVLSLRTKQGVLQRVVISQTITEIGGRLETGRWERQWESKFAIARTTGARSHRWKFSDFYGDTSHTAGGPNEPAHGEGLAQECARYRQLPGPLYAEVLVQLRNARRGVPTAPGRLPSAACGPGRVAWYVIPRHQATPAEGGA